MRTGRSLTVFRSLQPGGGVPGPGGGVPGPGGGVPGPGGGCTWSRGGTWSGTPPPCEQNDKQV